MPTYTVLEDSRQAICTTSQSDDAVNERTLTRSFNVLVTSADYGLSPLQVEADVQALGEVPNLGDSHRLSLYLFADSITTTPKSPTYFEIEVVYSSKGFDDGGGSPLTKPAETDFFTITSNEKIDADYNGTELKWAGTNEPIQGLSIPLSDLALRARKYIDGFNPIAFYNLINAVNSDTFFGFPPGTARIHDISATPEKTYWKMQVEIHFRKPYRGVTNEQAWYKRVKAEGFKVMYDNGFGTGYQPTRARVDQDDEESPFSPTPVLLDMESNPPAQRLGEGEDAQWALIQVFGTVAFSELGLGL